MARPAVKLRVHPAHLTSQNTAVVQGCVPLVDLKGDSYRLKDRDLGRTPRPATPDA